MIETVIILAAGRGTRLRPLTDKVPKVLVEVRGKPILDRIVETIDQTSIKRIIIVVGHLGDKVQKHYSNWIRPDRFEFRQQMTLDGTGGAVRLCASSIQGDFLVVFGDSLFRGNAVQRLIDSRFENAIGVVQVPDPQRYGVVELDANGRIIDVVEKPAQPRSNLAIAGIYKLQHQTLRYFQELKPSPRGELEMPDAIRSMIAHGLGVGAVALDGMVDVGTREQLQQAEAGDL